MIRQILDMQARHPGLDWSMACQSVAMAHGIEEYILLGIPPINEAQLKALEQLYREVSYSMTWLEFIEPVYAVMGGDGAIAVPWCGMHVCIETDGHLHT